MTRIKTKPRLEVSWSWLSFFGWIAFEIALAFFVSFVVLEGHPRQGPFFYVCLVLIAVHLWKRMVTREAHTGLFVMERDEGLDISGSVDTDCEPGLVPWHTINAVGISQGDVIIYTSQWPAIRLEYLPRRVGRATYKELRRVVAHRNPS